MKIFSRIFILYLFLPNLSYASSYLLTCLNTENQFTKNYLVDEKNKIVRHLNSFFPLTKQKFTVDKKFGDNFLENQIRLSVLLILATKEFPPLRYSISTNLQKIQVDTTKVIACPMGNYMNVLSLTEFNDWMFKKFNE